MKDSIKISKAIPGGETERGSMNSVASLIDEAKDSTKEEKRATTREDLFSLFLRRYLWQRGLSKVDFARRCYMPEEFLDDLLRGEIPADLIDDELLDDIATILVISTDVFRIILGREIPDLVENSEKKGEVSEALAKSISELEIYAAQILGELPEKEVCEHCKGVDKANQNVKYEKKPSTIERLLNSLKSCADTVLA